MEKYNAKEIHKRIVPENGITMQNNNGDIIFATSFISGCGIILEDKNKVTKFLLQIYDLRNLSQKRPEIIGFIEYRAQEMFNCGLLIDFDISHEKEKRIHLNFDHNFENLSQGFKSKLNNINHFHVDIDKEETNDNNVKLLFVNWENTIVKLIRQLKAVGFFNNYNCIVTPFYPTDYNFLDNIEKIINS